MSKTAAQIGGRYTFEDTYRECRPIISISFLPAIENRCTYRQRANTEARHSRYVSALAPLCFYHKDPSPSRRSRLTNSITVLRTFRVSITLHISMRHSTVGTREKGSWTTHVDQCVQACVAAN